MSYYCQNIADVQFLEHNSAVVFSVNYIQSRFIAAELCTQVAKLFDILNVKTVAEFKKAIEALRTDVGAGKGNFKNKYLSTELITKSVISRKHECS